MVYRERRPHKGIVFSGWMMRGRPTRSMPSEDCLPVIPTNLPTGLSL